MDRKWFVVIIFVIGFVLAAFQFRYELIPAGDSMAAYRLDRWTGEIILITGDDFVTVNLD